MIDQANIDPTGMVIDPNMKDLANQIHGTVGTHVDVTAGLDPSMLNANIVNNGSILTQDNNDQELLSEEEEEDDDDDSEVKERQPKKPSGVLEQNGLNIGAHLTGSSVQKKIKQIDPLSTEKTNTNVNSSLNKQNSAQRTNKVTKVFSGESDEWTDQRIREFQEQMEQSRLGIKKDDSKKKDAQAQNQDDNQNNMIQYETFESSSDDEMSKCLFESQALSF